MCLVRLLKRSVPFTNIEKRFTVKLLEYVQQECDDCEFLSQLKPETMEFYWLPRNTIVTSTLSRWTFVTPNSVYISDDAPVITYGKINTASYTTHIFSKCKSLMQDYACGSLLHELIHKFQFKIAPAKYLCNRLLLAIFGVDSWFYRFSIEMDADMYSIKPTIMINRLSHAFSLYHSIKLLETTKPRRYYTLVQKFNTTVDDRYAEMAYVLFNILATNGYVTEPVTNNLSGVQEEMES